MLEREELKKIPPDELEDEPVRGLVLHALRLKLANLGDNLPRRHASVREPRRQLGRVISAEHAVARLEVRGDLLALPDVVPNHGERRADFATLEGEDAVGVRIRRRDGALILVREWQVRDRRLEREGFDRVRGHGERALGGGGTGSRGSDFDSTLFLNGVKTSGRSDASDLNGRSSLW